MRFLTLLITIIATACSSPTVSAPIEKMEWSLTAIDGAALSDVPQKPITLQLNAAEKRASGFAGCNRFNGTYQLDAQEISFGPLMATRMACPTGLQSETKFLDAMRTVTTFAIMDDTLTLYNADAKETLRFTGSKRHHEKE